MADVGWVPYMSKQTCRNRPGRTEHDWVRHGGTGPGPTRLARRLPEVVQSRQTNSVVPSSGSDP
jgi:hypothetical protein